MNEEVLKANESRYPVPSGLFDISYLGGWDEVRETLYSKKGIWYQVLVWHLTERIFGQKPPVKDGKLRLTCWLDSRGTTSGIMPVWQIPFFCAERYRRYSAGTPLRGVIQYKHSMRFEWPGT